MNVKLHQNQALAVLNMKNGCILNGNVGTGKSITALYYYFTENKGIYVHNGKYKRMIDPKDLYIITTAMKRDSKEWEKELMRYDLYPNTYKNKIVIDSWNNIKKYEKINNSFFIFDEDRVTGNGSWVKSFLKITKKNNWIILSATPGDNWSQYIPVFIANGFYKNRTEFEREHCVYAPFCKFKKIYKYIGTKRLEKLRNSILVNIETERDIIKHHHTVLCDYDKDKYKFVLKNRWDIYEDKPIENITKLCYILRKIINSDESRLKRLVEVISLIELKKIIIFYNFNYEIDLIIQTIQRAFPEMIIRQWNGSYHQPIPEKDVASWAYLVQYNAGSEGWNCISSNSMIFFSQNYSYKTVKQACGRIDRMNTKFKELNYYHFKSLAPLDKAISRAIKNKKMFNERKFFI